MGVSYCSPFMRIDSDFRRVVTLDPMVWNLVGSAVRKDTKWRLQAAVKRVNVHSPHHISGVVLGVLHDGLTHRALMPGQGEALFVHTSFETMNK